MGVSTLSSLGLIVHEQRSRVRAETVAADPHLEHGSSCLTQIFSEKFLHVYSNTAVCWSCDARAGAQLHARAHMKVTLQQDNRTLSAQRCQNYQNIFFPFHRGMLEKPTVNHLQH